MKPCPYCASQIQDAAIKCRYCGMFITPEALAKTPPTPSISPPEPAPSPAAQIAVVTEPQPAVVAPSPPAPAAVQAVTPAPPAPVPITAGVQAAAPALTSPAAGTSEITFYSHPSGVRITNTRAIFGAKVYSMANVSSVGMTVVPPKWTIGVVAILGGLFLALAGEKGLGGIVFAIGIAWQLFQKSTYHVTIGSASGETSALASTDGDYITQVVRAMNEAFIKRG